MSCCCVSVYVRKYLYKESIIVLARMCIQVEICDGKGGGEYTCCYGFSCVGESQLYAVSFCIIHVYGCICVCSSLLQYKWLFSRVGELWNMNGPTEATVWYAAISIRLQCRHTVHA